MPLGRSGHAVSAAVRRPTISDVARQAGVSVSTVSRVLRDDRYIRASTSASVRSAIEELGYRPSAVARSLRTRATGTIGLIVPDLKDPFFPELVDGADAAARDLGYSIILGASASEESRTLHYLRLMVDHRVDGLVIAAAELPAASRQWLAGIPVPVVAVNAEAGDFAETSITSDNEGGARLAAEHLIGLGHRHLGYLRGPLGLSAAAARHRGFMAACEAAGIALGSVAVAVPELSMAGGARAAAALLAEHPEITGIASYSDPLAIGALHGVLAAGRNVPGDVSIVGLDDVTTAAWVTPGLTTVAQQKGEMGRLAVEYVDAMLKSPGGRHEVRHLRLPMSLVLRRSTCPPSPEAGGPAGDSRT